MGGSPKPCSKEFQPVLRRRKTGPVATTSRTVKRGLRVTHRRPQTASTFALVATARRTSGRGASRHSFRLARLPSPYVRILLQLKPDRRSGRTKCRRAMSRSIANTSRTNVAANRMNGDG